MHRPFRLILLTWTRPLLPFTQPRHPRWGRERRIAHRTTPTEVVRAQGSRHHGGRVARSRGHQPGVRRGAPDKGEGQEDAAKQVKKLAPGIVDGLTIDQGTIPPATTTDPNKTVFTKGPFTITLDCSLDGGDVELELFVSTSEENSVVNDGYVNIAGDLDPSDGDVFFTSYTGNAPGGDASTGGSLYYEYASFRSPSGTDFYAVRFGHELPGQPLLRGRVVPGPRVAPNAENAEGAALLRRPLPLATSRKRKRPEGPSARRWTPYETEASHGAATTVSPSGQVLRATLAGAPDRLRR